ncbi:cat eye syndrome critical region protein 6-like protein [Plakobranchus ocellatus]|uniref:Cat eye syndrome critical region protein 6-like protein n=1 Tax=Plakobranchus ocellatus TaxID=259542 RepID=A0AAV4BMK9_9GAST|nr:cat eye syndrome critical region protein 6-like protein [Plakobranchus ocellatus]
MFQGCMLNYYLVHHKNHNWYAWIAADVASVLSFLVAFFISYRELKLVLRASLSAKQRNAQPSVEAGSFPLMYFSWMVYSIVMVVRVAVIYQNFAYKIETDEFFGKNMLKFTIALAGVVFLLLVAAHHRAQPGTTARNQINLLSAMVPFDVIDAVDILSIFFDKDARDAMEPVLQWSVIVVACINLVLPVVPLMMLSNSHFGLQSISPSVNTLHRLLHIFVINGPLLAIRILMWHRQGQEVSPLIVKNMVMVLVVSMDLYESQEDKDDQEELQEDEEERDEGTGPSPRNSDTLAVVRYSNA